MLRLRLCLRRRRRLYSLSDKACILLPNYSNRFPRMKSVIVGFCAISYTAPPLSIFIPQLPPRLVLCVHWLTFVVSFRIISQNNSMKTLYPQPQLLVVFNFVHKLVEKKFNQLKFHEWKDGEIALEISTHRAANSFKAIDCVYCHLFHFIISQTSCHY